MKCLVFTICLFYKNKISVNKYIMTIYDTISCLKNNTFILSNFYDKYKDAPTFVGAST